MKPIETWLGSFPVKEAEGRLQKLLAQRNELDNEISELRFWIKRYRDRHPVVEQRQQPLILKLSGTPPPSPNGAKPTFRSSILSAMAAHGVGKEWNLNELRHELASRGALTLDDNGNMKLLSMLSLMTKADQLERVKQGVYRLPVPAQKDQG
jgi:hypothetical protein